MIAGFCNDIEQWFWRKTGHTNIICWLFGHKWEFVHRDCDTSLCGPGDPYDLWMCKRCEEYEKRY